MVAITGNITELSKKKETFIRRFGTGYKLCICLKRYLWPRDDCIESPTFVAVDCSNAAHRSMAGISAKSEMEILVGSYHGDCLRRSIRQEFADRPM